MVLHAQPALSGAVYDCLWLKLRLGYSLPTECLLLLSMHVCCSNGAGQTNMAGVSTI